LIHKELEQQEKNMRLLFHGAKYETSDKDREWEVKEENVGGKYRGSPWKIHRLAQQHFRRRTTEDLVYRGVHYNK
jgi:hypothetical protein